MEPGIEKLIKSLLVDGDTYKILKSPLTDKMPQEVQIKCRNSVEIFFEEFNKMESYTKIQDFIAVSRDISEWIPRLLGDTEEAKAYQLKFNVVFELLHLQMDDAVDSFPMDEVFLSQCCDCGLFTERRRDELIARLVSKGKTEAKYQFLWELPFRKHNAYSLLLLQLYKYKTNYIEKFCDDLHKNISKDGITEVEIIKCIMEYGENVVSSNMNLGLAEPEPNVDPIQMECDDPLGFDYNSHHQDIGGTLPLPRLSPFPDDEVFDMMFDRPASANFNLRTDVWTNPVVVPVSRPSTWSLYCRKCESYLCNSQDIRLAQGPFHIIVNKVFWIRASLTRARIAVLISRQIEADKHSKIIIFVKEVLYTRILKSETQKANMGFIQCKALVGTNKSADQGGGYCYRELSRD